jgi:hypothetical protein
MRTPMGILDRCSRSLHRTERDAALSPSIERNGIELAVGAIGPLNEHVTSRADTRDLCRQRFDVTREMRHEKEKRVRRFDKVSDSVSSPTSRSECAARR